MVAFLLVVVIYDASGSGDYHDGNCKACYRLAMMMKGEERKLNVMA